MPFKSEAQRRKFYQMYVEGKISKATIEKWESETPEDAKLPERKGKTKRVSPLEKLREHTRNMKNYA